MSVKKIMIYCGSDQPFCIEDLPYIPRVGEGVYLDKRPPHKVRELGHSIDTSGPDILQTIHIHLDPDL